MGTAAVADNLEAEQEELFRQMIHDEVDKWVDELVVDVFDKDNQPTLMELSELFTKTRQQFLGACLQRVIEQKYSYLLAQEYSPCPKCGKSCKSRRYSSKQIVTMQGDSELNRPWFYCTDCSLGFCPLDEVLEISRKQHQFDIQKKAVNLSADVTFARASDIFKDLTGQHLSDHFMHATFDAVGTQARLEDIIPSAAQIEKKIQRASTGNWRPILIVASDGAHLPTRPKAKRNEKRGKGQWQEAKGFRIYLLGDEQIIHIASWHQIQNEAQFGEDLALAASRVDQQSVRIALLGDGAGWLWKHMTSCFPKGREVLDYYHCAEHIHKAAKAQYGEQSEKALQWVESTICRLFYAEVSNVIRGLRRMEPKDDIAKEEIRKLIVYLTNNRQRIHYKSDRKGGYPIGSGGIESANKFICHTRMKRSGAWWVEETGNEMLRIRCAIYNGTYDKVFERYKQASVMSCLQCRINCAKIFFIINNGGLKMKKYIVTLTNDERRELIELISKGKHRSQKILNALILLACDEGEFQKGRSTNKVIAKVLNISMKKIDRIKKRFVEDGLDITLNGRKGSRIYKKKADGDFEAHLVALSCSDPPEGFSRWSLRLLADKVVELDYIDNISHETIRRVLKKTKSNLGLEKGG